MEVPHLVRERLGDESVEATVSLGDEDVVCVTPTRTLVYRGEGLLSDESVSIFPHDVERFDVSEGRRKTKFVFEYVDGTDSFTVPGNRAGTVRELLVGGILGVAGVTGADESVSDVFSFSELTLVVTSDRLVKHVGTPVWDEDFEEYPYEDVTGLTFEEGSVATQVVLSVDGHPERIKAPSDDARTVRKSLEQALFAYHDVGSLSALNEKVGVPEESTGDGGSPESLSLDAGISPLVDDAPAEGSDGRSAGEATPESADATGSGPDSAGTDGPGPSVDTVGTRTPDTRSGAAGAGTTGSVDPDDVAAMKRQLSTLTEAVKKQNALLRDQQETIDTLIDELRRGR
jgi:hypothetical protein